MEETKNTLKIADFTDKSLLIVDDDNPLRDRLSRAMEKKGFQSNAGRKCKTGDKSGNKFATSVCCCRSSSK